MTSSEAPQLGTHALEDFDFQVSKFECANKKNQPVHLREFVKLVQGLRSPDPVTVDEARDWKTRYGYHFRALADNDIEASSDSDNPPYRVAISRHDRAEDGWRSEGTCRIEGAWTDENDSWARDGMYYIWMENIIPRFSFIWNFYDGPPFETGASSSEIRFKQVKDDATRQLLETFGLQDETKREEDSWYIPLPTITIVDTQRGIDGWLQRRKLRAGPAKTSALVVKDGYAQETNTIFYEGDDKIGMLLQDPTTEILIDTDGHELPIVTPEYADESDLAKSFARGTTRHQLGLVTLKRALQAG